MVERPCRDIAAGGCRCRGSMPLRRPPRRCRCRRWPVRVTHCRWWLHGRAEGRGGVGFEGKVVGPHRLRAVDGDRAGAGHQAQRVAPSIGPYIHHTRVGGVAEGNVPGEAGLDIAEVCIIEQDIATAAAGRRCADTDGLAGCVGARWRDCRCRRYCRQCCSYR